MQQHICFWIAFKTYQDVKSSIFFKILETALLSCVFFNIPRQVYFYVWKFIIYFNPAFRTFAKELKREVNK